MSAGPRTPLETAIEAANLLVKRWGRGTALEIVGSVRRNVQHVGDLDFIAPMPKDWNKDALRDAIEDDRYGAGALFGQHRRYPVVVPVRGLKRGFRYAELTVTFAEGATSMPVQVARYDPGDRGNRGWVMLMRTGPKDFGKWLLWKHGQNNGLPKGQPSAAPEPGGGTYLRDKHGKPIPTPDEERVFAVAGLRPVVPERRAEVVARV